MPTVQFNFNMCACSPPFAPVNLQLSHTIDINGPSQQAFRLRGPSYGWLKEVQLAADLDIELACVIGGMDVPLDQLHTLSFVPTVLSKLKDATYAAINLYQIEGEHDDNHRVLRNRLALRYDSGSSVTPPLHLRSLKLIFYLPDGIHEFAQGLHAFDLYAVLANPPLPLQVCFDGLCSQLLAHLTNCYPSLFGEHAATLRKNEEYLASILNSLSSIFDRSSSVALMRQAESRQVALLNAVRSQLKNQGAVLGKAFASSEGTVATISNPIAAVELRTEDLARSISHDMCRTWLRLQPSENQESAGVPALDTEGTLEIHEDTLKTFLESDTGKEDLCGDSIIDSESDEGLNALDDSSPSPTQSILDMDSPPTSPYWLPTNHMTLPCAADEGRLESDSQSLYLE